jgi:hypothetical protein
MSIFGIQQYEDNLREYQDIDWRRRWGSDRNRLIPCWRVQICGESRKKKEGLFHF